jgi:hypothetical protein
LALSATIVIGCGDTDSPQASDPITPLARQVLEAIAKGDISTLQEVLAPGLSADATVTPGDTDSVIWNELVSGVARVRYENLQFTSPSIDGDRATIDASGDFRVNEGTPVPFDGMTLFFVRVGGKWYFESLE